MLNTVHKICRWIGYIAGILGLLCIITAKSGKAPLFVQILGPLLLLVMFITFLVTYILYIVAFMKKKAEKRAQKEEKIPLE